MWRTSETQNLLFEVLTKCNEIILFDTETTGFNANNNHIIQISAIKYKIESDESDKTFTETDRLNIYINPGYCVPPKITEITGITDDLLFDKPDEDESFDEIYNFFLNVDAVAAYNISFDQRFMEAMYERHNKAFKPKYSLDVLKMAKDLIDKDDTPNFKLGTIANLYGVDKDLTFHNSMDDVIAMARILSVFCFEYQKREEEKKELELTRKAKPKKIPIISQMNYWKGYRGMSRIYIHTNLGAFYYDIRNKIWDKKSDNLYDLEEVDMEALRKSAFQLANVETEEDFAHYRNE